MDYSRYGAIREIRDSASCILMYKPHAEAAESTSVNAARVHPGHRRRRATFSKRWPSGKQEPASQTGRLARQFDTTVGAEGSSARRKSGIAPRKNRTFERDCGTFFSLGRQARADQPGSREQSPCRDRGRSDKSTRSKRRPAFRPGGFSRASLAPGTAPCCGVLEGRSAAQQLQKKSSDKCLKRKASFDATASRDIPRKGPVLAPNANPDPRPGFAAGPLRQRFQAETAHVTLS